MSSIRPNSHPQAQQHFQVLKVSSDVGDPPFYHAGKAEDAYDTKWGACASCRTSACMQLYIVDVVMFHWERKYTSRESSLPVDRLVGPWRQVKGFMLRLGP